MDAPAIRHPESEAMRRRYRLELAKLADDPRFSEEERREFARMAESWAKTLPAEEGDQTP